MTDPMNDFSAAWQQLWQQASERTQSIKLKNTPAYPLARTVEMPADHGYETGALGFRITDLTIEGGGNPNSLTIKNCSQPTASSIHLTLQLADLTLQGHYALEVKPDPVVDLDTAGSLMELPAAACRPGAAGADEADTKLDPQKEEWLDQAREQRTELNKTANGQNLMAAYNEHNETYDHVFRNYPALAAAWKANGATREMAGDTSSSVQADEPINKSQKTYSGNVTYNGNAFRQQLNVAASCLYSDPDFDPRTGPPAGSKFWEASKAALAFGKGINRSTGNDKNSVNEVTKSQVYSTVEQEQGGLPDVSDGEALQVLMSTDIGAGGTEAPENLDWIVLDEEDRAHLRSLTNAIMKQKAEDAAIIGQPLLQGRCEALIDSVEAIVKITLPNGNADSPTAADISAEVVLPAFELDIDDTAWTGDVARIARQRLEQTYFIRSLLCEDIVYSLKQAIIKTTESCITDQHKA